MFSRRISVGVLAGIVGTAMLIATSGPSTAFTLSSPQEFPSKPIIVSFARRQSKSDRQAVCIDERMNLAGQSAPRPSHALSSIPVDASSVLMHANNRRVDHLHSGIMCACRAFIIAAHTPARRQRTKRL